MISSPFIATKAHQRDDLYLSSSDDEDGELILGSDDGGSDLEEREALESSSDSGSYDDDDDEEDGAASSASSGEDEYAKALASSHMQGGAKGGKKKGSLLTDLDDADEETKKARKIESWCNSSELKVSSRFRITFPQFHVSFYSEALDRCIGTRHLLASNSHLIGNFLQV